MLSSSLSFFWSRSSVRKKQRSRNTAVAWNARSERTPMGNTWRLAHVFLVHRIQGSRGIPRTGAPTPRVLGHVGFSWQTTIAKDAITWLKRLVRIRCDSSVTQAIVVRYRPRQTRWFGACTRAFAAGFTQTTVLAPGRRRNSTHTMTQGTGGSTRGSSTAGGGLRGRQARRRYIVVTVVLRGWGWINVSCVGSTTLTVGSWTLSTDWRNWQAMWAVKKTNVTVKGLMVWQPTLLNPSRLRFSRKPLKQKPNNNGWIRRLGFVVERY